MLYYFVLPFSFKPKIENIYKIIHFDEDKNFCILIEIRHCFGFSILRLEHYFTNLIFQRISENDRRRAMGMEEVGARSDAGKHAVVTMQVHVGFIKKTKIFWPTSILFRCWRNR